MSRRRRHLLRGLDSAWHETLARRIETRISGILSRPDALEVCCPVFRAVLTAVTAGRTGRREHCINLPLMDIQWQRDEPGHRHIEGDLTFVRPPHGTRVTADDCRTKAAGAAWYPGHRPPGVDPGLPDPPSLPATSPAPV